MLDSWEPYRLELLIDLLDHLRVPINSEQRSKRVGTVPYYGANGQQGWIDKPLFDEPLILLAEDGGNFDEFATRPIAYRISGPSWVNNHAHIVRAKMGVDQNFIFWVLVNKDIRKYISGGTRTKLTQAELRSIEVLRPSYPEQQRIAEILDTLDEAIRKTEGVIAKLRQVKQGLLHDLLTRGLDDNGELRDPDRHPEKFHMTPLGRLPKGWSVGSVHDVAATDRQAIQTGPFGAQLGSNDFINAGVPVLRIGNVQWGYLDLDDLQHVSHKKADRLSRFKVQAGDLLFARQGATTAMR